LPIIAAQISICQIHIYLTRKGSSSSSALILYQYVTCNQFIIDTIYNANALASMPFALRLYLQGRLKNISNNSSTMLICIANAPRLLQKQHNGLITRCKPAQDTAGTMSAATCIQIVAIPTGGARKLSSRNHVCPGIALLQYDWSILHAGQLSQHNLCMLAATPRSDRRPRSEPHTANDC